MQDLSHQEKGGRVTQAKRRLLKAVSDADLDVFYRETGSDWEPKNMVIRVSKPIRQMTLDPKRPPVLLSPKIHGYNVKIGKIKTNYPKDRSVKTYDFIDLWNPDQEQVLVDWIKQHKFKGIEIDLFQDQAILLVDNTGSQERLFWELKTDEEKEALINVLKEEKLL